MNDGGGNTLFPDSRHFGVSVAAHGFEPEFITHVAFKLLVIFLSALNLAEMNKGSGGVGILLVPCPDTTGMHEVVLTNDTEIIIEQFTIAAGTRCGFNDGNTQDNSGGNTIFIGK